MAGYLAHEKSFVRRYAIVAGVVGFHLVLLYVLTGWPGRHHPAEILLRARIFPDRPPAHAP